MMNLKNFKWMTKPSGRNILSEEVGGQIVLDFGKYHLSIIDDGYGREKGLLEIGLFEAEDGVATVMAGLPEITGEDDTVKGFLTEEDVDGIIKKLYSITKQEPVQV